MLVIGACPLTGQTVPFPATPGKRPLCAPTSWPGIGLRYAFPDMETNEPVGPDLLTRMLATRWLRNLIAIAIFVRVVDIYYDAGKSFIRGVQSGWEAGGKDSSAARPMAR